MDTKYKYIYPILSIYAEEITTLVFPKPVLERGPSAILPFGFQPLAHISALPSSE